MLRRRSATRSDYDPDPLERGPDRLTRVVGCIVRPDGKRYLPRVEPDPVAV
jgi:hypothetical protein